MEVDLENVQEQQISESVQPINPQGARWMPHFQRRGQLAYYTLPNTRDLKSIKLNFSSITNDRIPRQCRDFITVSVNLKLRMILQTVITTFLDHQTELFASNDPSVVSYTNDSKLMNFKHRMEAKLRDPKNSSEFKDADSHTARYPQSQGSTHPGQSVLPPSHQTFSSDSRIVSQMAHQNSPVGTAAPGRPATPTQQYRETRWVKESTPTPYERHVKDVLYPHALPLTTRQIITINQAIQTADTDHVAVGTDLDEPQRVVSQTMQLGLNMVTLRHLQAYASISPKEFSPYLMSKIQQRMNETSSTPLSFHRLIVKPT
ncbi:hypothetical protein BLNAU_5790 [Blattamonas nauphoetae]|uniref:Uncharacterized protein n=1 Tax=Blattamonas nauphoetae TaxID=2049346 RepID=A0ABQ9Y644_9EUKA|nr:hypothetical protein BLNAU_5790 [Blattamonas nauphoetae]